MSNYIFLIGGRTGGPIIPLLAIFEGIKDSLSTSKDNSETIVPVIIEVKKGFGTKLAIQNKFAIEFLPQAKLNLLTFNKLNFGQLLLGILDAFWNICKLTISVLLSVTLLIRYRPKAILGAGGFLIVPITLAARVTNFLRLTRTKIIIHQQDPLPGLANRLAITAAHIKSCVFEYTRSNFPLFKDCQIIPNPINTRLYDNTVWLEDDKELIEFVNHKTKPLFLIFGGVSGAQAINNWVIANLEALTEQFQVIHLTGSIFGYSKPSRSPNYLSRTSLTIDMPKVLRESDLVLCRPGLGSVTELLYLNKPAFLCPMPNSHQTKNAELVSEYFRIIDQNHITEWVSLISTAYPQEFININFPSKVIAKKKLSEYYNQITEVMFDKS